MCWFWPKRMFELRKYRVLMLNFTQDWYKVWRKTESFQKWHEENFGKFSSEHVRKFKNWDFDGILLPKFECVRAQNLQGSFVSWQWKMMQNLRNSLFSSNWHEEFDKFWPRALKNLKNLYFNGLLLTKVYNVWARKKYRGAICGHRRLIENLKKNGLVLSKMT